MSGQNQNLDWAAGLLGQSNLPKQSPATFQTTQNAETSSTSWPTTAPAEKTTEYDLTTHKSASVSSHRSTPLIPPAISLAKVTVFSEKLQGQTFVLNQQTTQLGRAPTNEIVVPDPCVSGRHCVFEIRDDGVWIRDLNSANGTYVNGQSVTECILRSGDVIRCGTSVVKFELALKRPRMDTASAAQVQAQYQKSAASVSPQSTLQPSDDQGPISFEKIKKSRVNRTKASESSKRADPSKILTVLLTIVLLVLIAFAIIYYFQPSLLPWLLK